MPDIDPDVKAALESWKNAICGAKALCVGVARGPLTPPANQRTLEGHLRTADAQLDYLRLPGKLGGPIANPCPPVDTSAMDLADITASGCQIACDALEKYCEDGATDEVKCLVKQADEMMPATFTLAGI